MALMRKCTQCGTVDPRGAWGLADVDKKLDASTSTIYPIGSVSKEFTAALVLTAPHRVYSLYVGGEKVVDLWGGYRDGLSRAPGTSQ